jgi:membrane-associated phospholipid phosphatase
MHRRRLSIVTVLLLLGAQSGWAQERQPLVPAPPLSPLSSLRSVTDSTTVWFTHRDRMAAAAFAGTTLLALPFDRAAAHWVQQPAVHRNARVASGASAIRWLGDPGALTLSASTFVVGRMTHHDGLADAGLHSTQAIVFGGATTNALKFVIGRARPREVDGGNAFTFRPGRGINDYAAFPSGHTTAAFAAASAVSAELACSAFAQSHPRIGRVTPLLLYGAAALVGVSRMYHDAHWSSDVVAGAGIGTISGRVTVRRLHHGGTRNRFDRWMLGGGTTGCR